MSSHSVLTHKVSAEKLFLCCSQNSLFFDFWQFYYTMSRCGSLYLDLRWLGFLDLMSVSFPRFGKFRVLQQQAISSALFWAAARHPEYISSLSMPMLGKADTVSLGQPSDEPECQTNSPLLLLPPKREAFLPVFALLTDFNAAPPGFLLAWNAVLSYLQSGILIKVFWVTYHC